MKCRNCNETLDAHAPMEGNEIIKEGDLSICGYCGAISLFDKELNLVPMTPEELVHLNDESPEAFDQLIKIRSAIHSLKAKNAV